MNTTNTSAEKTETAAQKKDSFAEVIRKVALASVGAVVLAQEEVEDFVGRLVQKGELAEKEGRSLVNDLVEKRKQKQSAREERTGPVGAVTSAIDSTVDKVLHKINVPTRTDVEELAKKIDEIDKKIEALANTRKAHA